MRKADEVQWVYMHLPFGRVRSPSYEHFQAFWALPTALRFSGFQSEDLEGPVFHCSDAIRTGTCSLPWSSGEGSHHYEGSQMSVPSGQDLALSRAMIFRPGGS
jgi:hypothetical protein